MEGIVNVFGKSFEYDFLSGWVKYNRIQNQVSQEALAHSICSTSHLSYFENGKKPLRGEIIEALLNKLNINTIVDVENIGLIRQKFTNMVLQIESFDYDAAKIIYEDLMDIKSLIGISPYNIEYKIYELTYNILVERKSYNDLYEDVKTLDKIYSSLSEALQYLYMLVTGKHIYDFKDHNEGIKRLIKAHKLRETQWINYRLGVAYCLNNEHLKATFYLQKALESYEKGGKYYNALWCHNFLGTCYTSLKLYERAETHFKAVLSGSDYFSMNKNTWGIYTSLSNLSICKNEYEESLKWSLLAMETADSPSSKPEDSRWIKAAWHMNEEPLIGAYYHIEACIKLNRIDECKKVFDKFLCEKHKDLRYYEFLYFLYLSIYHFSQDIFYKEVTENIIPYYKDIGYLNLYKKIKIKLAEYLEKNRRYKEAAEIYKELFL